MAIRLARIGAIAVGFFVIFTLSQQATAVRHATQFPRGPTVSEAKAGARLIPGLEPAPPPVHSPAAEQ